MPAVALMAAVLPEFDMSCVRHARFAGAWLGPGRLCCTGSTAKCRPQSRVVWGAMLPHTGPRLSGCVVLLPDLFEGGAWLLDSAQCN
jgi:hypothetical protein